MNLLVRANCANCREPLSVVWDDWREKVVGFVCGYCGLIYCNEKPVEKEWYVTPGGGSRNLKVRSFR